MTAIDWFSLLHPVLVILFVYPVVGATIRLGILVREKRLGITKQPAPVPREHADHFRGVWHLVARRSSGSARRGNLAFRTHIHYRIPCCGWRG